VIKTEDTFVSTYDNLKLGAGKTLKLSALRRILLPSRKDEKHECSRKYLARVINNTEHLERKGIFQIDNTITSVIYGAPLGTLAYLAHLEYLNLFTQVNSVAQVVPDLSNLELSTLTGAALGGIVGTISGALKRNRSFFDFTSSQDIMSPRPWDALQLLDLELSFYKDLAKYQEDPEKVKAVRLNWAYMDMHEPREDNFQGKMTARQIENLKKNKLIRNEGITHFYQGTEELLSQY
jgi:hypothetical protein